MEKQDIFDRKMSCRFLRPLQPFYKKYKEQLLYLFFGGLAFLVNVCTYALMGLVVHHLAANGLYLRRMNRILRVFLSAEFCNFP